MGEEEGNKGTAASSSSRSPPQHHREGEVVSFAAVPPPNSDVTPSSRPASTIFRLLCSRFRVTTTRCREGATLVVRIDVSWMADGLHLRAMDCSEVVYATPETQGRPA
ncbi:hypothetical protein DY000_02037587 [Brassica cretica]|uniref:Uncharacterized protein n=1 Tax=Brassica cretica TaxID=69181 RepID=A0ABQ7B4Q4_BRACR|nr:hypothetical protein DY000_02037587 [Brassica cretica]